MAPVRKIGSDESLPPPGPPPVFGTDGTRCVGVAVAAVGVGVDGAVVAVAGRGVAVAVRAVDVAVAVAVVVPGTVVAVAVAVALGVAVAPVCVPTSMPVIGAQSGRTLGCSQNTATTDVPSPWTT